MENTDVALVLSEIADILDLTGGNQFKVRAYRQAAQVVDTLPGPVSEYWRRGQLLSLPGIGEGIGAKIVELLETGRCAEHDRLARQVPSGVLELLRLEGVGPKTVAAVWHTLGITDVAGLEKACLDGRLRQIPRMGPTRCKSILDAIERYRSRTGRMLLHRAVGYADTIVARLRKVPGVCEAIPVGSVRRRRETVGDLDILVTARNAAAPMRAFVAMPEVSAVLAEGPTKSSVRLTSGLQVDLRVLPRESLGAALHYFTGSKAHNIALRTRAVRRGVKVSEYGVFDREGNRLSGAREEDVFEAVGLPWIPPELREGAGEIEAAEDGRLPKLVEEAELRGDLHVHSDASSDGHCSLEELWLAGLQLGREYIAICDHSRSRPLGLTAQGLLEHAARIRAFNREHPNGPRLLAGVEVDILPDGSLDLPLEVLARLDWVVASIHSRFRDSGARLTARMVSAVRSGVVDVIGHPSGRILGSRDPYPFDLPRLLEAARAAGVALEVNAQPDRLDLNDKGCRLAKEAGVPVAISTDAHLADHLANLRYGVWVARRGWLEARDVINTLDLARLRAWRRRGHRAVRHEPALPAGR
ncbi:MAG: DNA polymerase/3'-5' exonuclease PolX [Myxococcales bacterium]